MTVTKASLGIGELHFSNSPARRHTKKQQRKISNTLIMFVFQIANNLLSILDNDLYPRSPCSPECRHSKD